jgi:hypothetical protein
VARNIHTQLLPLAALVLAAICGCAQDRPASSSRPLDISQFHEAGPQPRAPDRSKPPLLDVRFGSDVGIFPAHWRTPEVKIRATPLKPALRAPAADRLQAAAAKYPTWLLLRHLQRVYVLGSLSFSGTKAGGTNSQDCIYLALGGGQPDDLAYLERSFHAEFSSILLRAYERDFLRAQWEASNQSFTYSGSGVKAIRRGAGSNHWSIWLAPGGALTEHAMSSLENDFNEFAEGLFMNGPTFWRWTSSYPRLNAKVELAIQFYGTIAPVFTAEHFKALPPDQNESIFIELTP